jgi:hypothetical protein
MPVTSTHLVCPKHILEVSAHHSFVDVPHTGGLEVSAHTGGQTALRRIKMVFKFTPTEPQTCAACTCGAAGDRISISGAPPARSYWGSLQAVRCDVFPWPKSFDAGGEH